MEPKITIVRAKSIQETIEDLFDNFDFIACYEMEWERRKEFRKHGKHEFRIRDLKNQFSKALQDVVDKAQELENSGDNKFDKLLSAENGSFLALAEWIEEFDLPSFHPGDEEKVERHEEHLYLAIYYFADSLNTSMV